MCLYVETKTAAYKNFYKSSLFSTLLYRCKCFHRTLQLLTCKCLMLLLLLSWKLPHLVNKTVIKGAQSSSLLCFYKYHRLFCMQLCLIILKNASCSCSQIFRVEGKNHLNAVEQSKQALLDGASKWSANISVTGIMNDQKETPFIYSIAKPHSLIAFPFYHCFNFPIRFLIFP